jgi:hypothetical protein
VVNGTRHIGLSVVVHRVEGALPLSQLYLSMEVRCSSWTTIACRA